MCKAFTLESVFLRRIIQIAKLFHFPIWIHYSHGLSIVLFCIVYINGNPSVSSSGEKKNVPTPRIWTRYLKTAASEILPSINLQWWFIHEELTVNCWFICTASYGFKLLLKSTQFVGFDEICKICGNFGESDETEDRLLTDLYEWIHVTWLERP